jgi:hypothetical protein
MIHGKKQNRLLIQIAFIQNVVTQKMFVDYIIEESYVLRRLRGMTTHNIIIKIKSRCRPKEIILCLKKELEEWKKYDAIQDYKLELREHD